MLADGCKFSKKMPFPHFIDFTSMLALRKGESDPLDLGSSLDLFAAPMIF
jgi:hypothetical protein